jgi:hypothetical protein
MTQVSNEQAARILDALRAAYSDPLRKKREERDILQKMTQLAHAHYRPAIDFFVSGLDDPDWSWRLEHLGALGYHYRFDKDNAVVAKIRAILTSDPSEMVRMSAASVLARFATWPDPTLVQVLEHDVDADVRRAAFESLLLVMGIARRDLAKVRGQMVIDELQPSTSTLRLIAEQHGKPLLVEK